METLYYSHVRSPIGPLTVAVSGRGLVALEFGAEPPAKHRRAWRDVEWKESAEKTAPYVKQLEEYFAGVRREFTLPLDLRGTEFQKRCWQALLEIPYGRTRSYAEVARAVGKPRAFRAVGLANNRNPIAIVVPCHRVIGKDGSLTGYGGGLDVKEELLRLEGAL
ncbi:MAG TPA: methylated-DNA--[protein]-cysteine S-methyltransferase [Terriglobales bacterium]|nr:methylated-DNA--[protein]-cysteine S-methyltransferase [Terriglobales bacterium]